MSKLINISVLFFIIFVPIGSTFASMKSSDDHRETSHKENIHRSNLKQSIVTEAHQEEFSRFTTDEKEGLMSIPAELYMDIIFRTLSIKELLNFYEASRWCHNLVKGFMQQNHFKKPSLETQKVYLKNNKNFNTIAGLYRASRSIFKENVLLDLSGVPILPANQELLLNFTDARGLVLRHENRENLKFVNAFKKLETLELHFPKKFQVTHLMHGANMGFLDLPKLRHLTLTNYHYPWIVCKRTLEKIESLRLRRCRVIYIYLEKIQKVKKLSLSDCDSPAYPMNPSANLSELTALRIKNCSPSVIDQLPWMTTLREITLHSQVMTLNLAKKINRCSIVEFSNVTLEDSPQNPKALILESLREMNPIELNLKGSGIKIENFYPSQSEESLNLERLILDNYSLQKQGFNNYKNLRILKLNNSDVVDLQLSFCRHVEKLEITNCKKVNGHFLKLLDRLEDLKIMNCPNFRFMLPAQMGTAREQKRKIILENQLHPSRYLETLKNLEVEGRNIFDYELKFFTNLQTLRISKNAALCGVNLVNFNHLSRLSLKMCKNFQASALSNFKNARLIEVAKCKKFDDKSGCYLNPQGLGSCDGADPLHATCKCAYSLSIKGSKNPKNNSKAYLWMRKY